MLTFSSFWLFYTCEQFTEPGHIYFDDRITSATIETLIEQIDQTGQTNNIIAVHLTSRGGTSSCAVQYGDYIANLQKQGKTIITVIDKYASSA